MSVLVQYTDRIAGNIECLLYFYVLNFYKLSNFPSLLFVQITKFKPNLFRLFKIFFKIVQMHINFLKICNTITIFFQINTLYGQTFYFTSTSTEGYLQLPGLKTALRAGFFGSTRIFIGAPFVIHGLNQNHCDLPLQVSPLTLY